MRIRFSQDIWVILVLLLFLIAVGWMGGKRQSNGGLEVIPKRTSYSTRPSGVKALHDTLHELGYPVTRHLKPFTSPPKEGVMLVISPDMQTPVSGGEWTAIRKWVESGNILIVASKTLSPEDWPGKKPKTEKSSAACPSFLSPNVKSFSTPEAAAIFDTKWEFGDAATIPQPRVSHQSRKTVRTALRKSLKKQMEYQLIPLFSGKSGTTVAYAPCGKGAVINLCSAWCVSNQGISADDNFLLILNAIDYRSPGKKPLITFDEYHHGYGRTPGIASLIGTPARLGLAQLAMAFVLLVFAVSRRYGRPIPLREGMRQRNEYLNSMTSLLRRAHAAGVVKSALERKFLDDVGRVLGLPPNSDEQTVLEAMAIRHPEKTEQLRQLLSIVQASPDEALDDATLMILTARRTQFRKELMKAK